MKTHWKCILTAKFRWGMLFVAISFLIYPNHAAAQRENPQPSTAIVGRGGALSAEERLKLIRRNAEKAIDNAQCTS